MEIQRSFNEILFGLAVITIGSVFLVAFMRITLLALDRHLDRQREEREETE